MYHRRQSNNANGDPDMTIRTTGIYYTDILPDGDIEPGLPVDLVPHVLRLLSTGNEKEMASLR